MEKVNKNTELELPAPESIFGFMNDILYSGIYVVNYYELINTYQFSRRQLIRLSCDMDNANNLLAGALVRVYYTFNKGPKYSIGRIVEFKRGKEYAYQFSVTKRALSNIYVEIFVFDTNTVKSYTFESISNSQIQQIEYDRAKEKMRLAEYSWMKIKNKTMILNYMSNNIIPSFLEFARSNEQNIEVFTEKYRHLTMYKCLSCETICADHLTQIFHLCKSCIVKYIV